MVEKKRVMSNLLKVREQVWPELDHQVPPDLHLGEQQGLCPDVDGREGLHEELHTFAAAQDVFRRDRGKQKSAIVPVLSYGLEFNTRISLKGKIKNGGESLWLTWIEGKVVYEALPGNEGNFLDGGRRAAETKFLQMQKRVDEGASSVQQLWTYIYICLKKMSFANTDH